MKRYLREVLAVARLDFAEVRRSRWVLFSLALYAVLGAVFVLVGMRESMVMSFSGMGRVLLSMVHVLVLILPLLALAACGQVVNRSREDGTLELLFSHPVRRSAYFTAISLTRYLTLLLPLALTLIALAIVAWVAFEESLNWAYLGQTLAICASLLACFVGVGVAVSTFIRSQAGAVIWLLLLWATGVCFLDFGLIALMLRAQLNPQTIILLASVNPVQTARMALLAGASEELTVLGPVGFYLAHHIGPGLVLALGIAWPACLGIASWFVALTQFRQADIV